jgi:putative ABC transport system permease protein
MVGVVSPDFFKVFGTQPILGRSFSTGDAKTGAAPTALVNEGYWRQDLGSPPDLSQAHLRVGGKVFSVIGVLPAGFRFPAEVDLWMPADLDGENPHRTSHNYSAVARLRDGVSVEQAHRDISAIARPFTTPRASRATISSRMAWSSRCRPRSRARRALPCWSCSAR